MHYYQLQWSWFWYLARGRSRYVGSFVSPNDYQLATSSEYEYDENNLLSEYVFYGGYFPFTMSFDYEDNRMTTVYEYAERKDEPWSYTRYIIWEGQNIRGMDDVTYAYNNIIDNFNMFNMFVRSENLVSKVSEKRSSGEGAIQYDYSYTRNEDGDICRIDIADGYFYYLIKYYD